MAGTKSNKLEALGVKAAAEMLMTRQDYAGARDRLLKAKQLFPGLDHIDSMLSVCEILSAGKSKFSSCDIDHYWVLQLLPSSTFSDVTSQYRKLVGSLQPISGDFPGTELAKELLDNAFFVLSDPRKRLVFDAKRETTWEAYKSTKKLLCSSSPNEETTAREGASTRNASLNVSNNKCTEPRDVAIREDVSMPSARFGTASKGLPSSPSYSQGETVMPNRMSRVAEGQVWAVDNGKGSMPWRCVRINSVISEAQVCATLLEPQAGVDYGNDGKMERIPVACGIFTVEGVDIKLGMSQLSHQMDCLEHETEPWYKICPKGGEIWAIYKGWSNKWKRLDYDRYRCLVVEILSDWPDSSTTVAKLEKVKGCSTFFQRQHYDGFELTRRVSRAEMPSFSHRIPAFRVPGIGKYSIPECSWHLEPQALPHRTEWTHANC